MLVNTGQTILGLLPTPSERGDLSTYLEQLIFYFLGSWKAEHSFGRSCVERALEDENVASVHLRRCQRFRGQIRPVASLHFSLFLPSVLQNGKNARGCLQIFKRIKKKKKKSIAVSYILAFNSFSVPLPPTPGEFSSSSNIAHNG